MDNPIKKEVRIGDCRLLLGDCINIMPTLDKVDAVVTDPPYGIKAAEGFSGAGGFSKPIKRREYVGNWDNEKPELYQLFIWPKCKHIIWGGNYFTDQLPQSNFWLVWDKQNTMPTHSDCELAWTDLPRNSVKRLVYMQNGCMSKEKERFHPTQKAVGVMEWCLEFLPESDLILDPFMGSGTTGVTCAKLGRKFIGIELDSSYFDIACQRIEDAYKQSDLFISPPSIPPIQTKLFKEE